MKKTRIFEPGELEEKVTKVLSHLAESPEVDLNTPFSSDKFVRGGMDSLDHVEVILELESALDVHIADKDLAEMRCGADVVKYLTA